MGRLVNLLLALGSIVLVLALLETGARVLGVRTGFLLGALDECTRRSALLSVELVPNCTGTLRNTAVVTNSLGLRSPEVRDDGSLRILCAGDSSTFDVTQEENYPSDLQRLLDERTGPRRYQVINAGVPGYSSYQGLLYLRERGLALHPVIVVIGYGFNELFRVGNDEIRLRRERLMMPLLQLDDMLLRASTLYRWIRYRTATNPSGLDYRVTPPQYRRNLEAIIRLVREHGAKPLLLDFFIRPHVDAPERGFPETLAAVSRDLDVRLVYSPGPRLDFVHPTVEGYRVLAAAILDVLVEQGWLQ